MRPYNKGPAPALASAVARAIVRVAIAVTLVALVAAPRLDAQSFGRNKVRYDNFDFRALASEHFDVHYYPAESLAASDAARMAERWYARHSAMLLFESGRSPLIFYADHADFQQTNVIGGFIGEGTGGVTEGSRERVIMPFTGAYAETDHVLGHEIVHVYQYRIAKDMPNGLRSIAGIPLWLIEGMAEYMSLGRNDPNTAMWLRDALRRDDLPTLDQLTNDPRYFPYRYGQALWAYIGGRWGDATVNQLFRAALESGWANGVTKVLGVKPDSLSKMWHAAIREQYTPTFAGQTAPDSTGRPVVRTREDGEQNLAPAISPDGRYVAFFSSRDLFGIDIYLAEVATGRIIRRLTSITSNPHFDALSFINSAGSFSPDGRQLAVVTFAEGDNEITIFNASNGRVVRRIRPRGVTGLLDPAWSPDGRRIAFSGLKGGISDLYVFDLETGEAKALTSGREAELQPAWSPDGTKLAFTTDRGGRTDFDALTFGPMRLATIPADGSNADITLLETFAYGKAINPQYAADGRSIFFVSDQDGVSNIYRRSEDGGVQRLTNISTGVSGISGLSPAISVARSTGTVVFSVFHKAGYAIRSVDPSVVTADARAAAPQSAEAPAAVAGVLPPAVTAMPDAGVERALANDSTGLVPASALTPTKVDGRLRLDYVGGPSIGVTVGGGYGTGLGGGVGLGFADMLGNHDLGVVIQAQGDIKDIGGAVYYLNQKRRWGWGANLSHIPYAGIFASAANVDFETGEGTIPGAIIVQQLQRIYFQNASLVAQYPFSRTRRVEFSGGLQRIAFDVEVDSLFVIGNQIVDRVRRDVPSLPGLNFGRGTAALVGDNSFSAFTSPIAGGRYRLEVGANAGDLDYQDALVDVRRYFFMRPLTFAVRGLHFGRYGRDAEGGLLQPLFVGQSLLIRGYDAQTFKLSECSAAPGGGESCPQFERLNGSRIAIMNLELRIPLFGNDRFGLVSVPFLPIELTPFFDAGVAWTKSESPDLRFDRETTDRVPVFSAGATTRLNLFGYAVLEIYWAHPFQRPGRSGIWGFQLAPGW